MVQWLGVCSFTAEGHGSIPGWGTRSYKLCSGVKEKNYTFLVSILKSTIHEVIVGIPESVILNQSHIDSIISCCMNISYVFNNLKSWERRES